jgi:hypothetical protein
MFGEFSYGQSLGFQVLGLIFDALLAQKFEGGIVVVRSGELTLSLRAD